CQAVGIITINTYKGDAVRRLTGHATGGAGHIVPGRDGEPGDRAAEEGRSTEHKQTHDSILSDGPPSRQTGSPRADCDHGGGLWWASFGRVVASRHPGATACHQDRKKTRYGSHMADRSVLVTGASGGLGGAVVAAFRTAGWRVVAPVRGIAPTRE